jgi:hypothetical protein
VSDPVVAPTTEADAEVIKASKQLSFDDEDGPLKEARGVYLDGPQEDEDGD